MVIHFQADAYTVAYAGECIPLLPKEYALFAYLYEHSNRTFSREELLDAVWGLEEPSDRTVDDHIYRLRKKLLKWSDHLTIETVRGQGYKLALTNKQPPDLPLKSDSQFAESVKKLFCTYHGFGMGAAMQTLVSNQEVLGFDIDPFYSVYTHFVSGDFLWIVDTEELTFWQKSVYLVHLFSATRLDPQASVYYYERLLSNQALLPEEWQKETELNIVWPYIEAGRLDQAEKQLQALEPWVSDLHSTSFTLVYCAKKLVLHLLNGEQQQAAAILADCEALIQKQPLQREKGMLYTTKALFLYRQGDRDAARHTLDEGIEIIKATKFVPHLIENVRKILLFRDSLIRDPEHVKKYEKLWQQLSRQYHFAAVAKKSEVLLKTHL